ncbi:uncharacterized protein LOC121046083 [Ixodes scapularis]|uniref:uncharacterized protein LOC121046083 n=1 Tax=Ixodes scapularis TaxID=6945 RepID=UPI001AD6D2A8|nr:uncharacterized protein LOC121046083 [Ixodes scapularis]
MCSLQPLVEKEEEGNGTMHPAVLYPSALAMSRRFTPPSLGELATNVVATVILPAVEECVPPEGIDGLPERMNPFITCAAPLLEHLIEQVQRKRGPHSLSCLQFEILLCRGGVTRLDLFLTSEFLESREPSRFERIFSRIGRYGSQLVDLSLEFYMTCSNEELCAMLSKLPNLRHFLVAFENLTDKVLETLGQSCEQLHRLTLCETPQITDVGLRSLVDEAGSRGCLNLSFISVEGAPVGVTVKSIVYLLERLPNLEAINLPSLDKALVVLNEIKPTDFRLSLREYKDINAFAVQTSVRPTRREFLSKAVELCPRLRAIEIEVKTTDDISPLRLLTGLAELTIRTSESTSEWFFYTQLEPVLQEAGIKMSVLKLAMPDVDLAAIDTACPNIRMLQLVSVNMCWRRNGIKVREQPFSELEVLFVHPESTHSLKTRDLCLLFNCSYGIKDLAIGLCDCFDDIFLMDALQRGLLRNLNRIEFHSMRKISILGIQQLVLLDELLESLTLKDCTALSPDDLAFLTGSSYTLNFDLKVQT